MWKKPRLMVLFSPTVTKIAPNIIWMIGGDIYGNIKTEVWNMLANTIKSIDKNHLMTFHPFGRTLSAEWFNDAPGWISICFKVDTAATDKAKMTKRHCYHKAQKKTTGDMWNIVLLKSHYVRLLMESRLMKPFPKDFMTLRKVSGKTTMYADMLTGRFFCRFIRSYVRS